MEKKLPTRTCIGTGVKNEKRNMIRLVRVLDNKVVVDIRGKEKGRGANLLMNIEAFDLAVKKHAIERALKLDYTLTTIQIEDLRNEFLKALEEKQLRSGNKKLNYKVTKEEFAKIANS